MDIKKLAELARLSLSDEEITGFEKDLNAIISYVSKIEGAESGVLGSAHTDLRNVMRGDDLPFEPGTFTKEILQNAPAVEDGYLKVKKIL